jgi:hypothetical protein
MSEVVYVSKIHIAREKGPLRSVKMPAEDHPLYFGVHDAIAVHYHMTPQISQPHAATIDYVVAAAGR